MKAWWGGDEQGEVWAERFCSWVWGLDLVVVVFLVFFVALGGGKWKRHRGRGIGWNLKAILMGTGGKGPCFNGVELVTIRVLKEPHESVVLDERQTAIELVPRWGEGRIYTLNPRGKPLDPLLCEFTHEWKFFYLLCLHVFLRHCKAGSIC